MVELMLPPEGWTWLRIDVMTNLGHKVDESVAAGLRGGGAFAQHAAEKFHGLVWFDDGRWHERVSVHHEPVGCYSADTLQELMKTVNDEHGWA